MSHFRAYRAVIDPNGSRSVTFTDDRRRRIINVINHHGARLTLHWRCWLGGGDTFNLHRKVHHRHHPHHHHCRSGKLHAETTMAKNGKNGNGARAVPRKAPHVNSLRKSTRKAATHYSPAIIEYRFASSCLAPVGWEAKAASHNDEVCFSIFRTSRGGGESRNDLLRWKRHFIIHNTASLHARRHRRVDEKKTYKNLRNGKNVSSLCSEGILCSVFDLSHADAEKTWNFGPAL